MTMNIVGTGLKFPEMPDKNMSVDSSVP